MNASRKFNHRITIQQIEKRSVGDGSEETDLSDDRNWATYATRWAEVQTKGGREFWKVDKVDAEVSHLIRVPYESVTARIDSTMRIKLSTRTINIVSVIDVDENHEVIEMQCKEPK